MFNEMPIPIFDYTSMMCLLFSCDADPAALAKYVVALVKKDRPAEELKHVCKDQLEVFLSEGTIKLLLSSSSPL